LRGVYIMPKRKGSKNGIKKEGVCFWCKKEFSYRVPEAFSQKMNRTIIYQVFCSRECEYEHEKYAHQIERANQALNEVRDRKIIKVCSECGLVAIKKKMDCKWCPKCHGRYELREVIEK